MHYIIKCLIGICLIWIFTFTVSLVYAEEDTSFQVICSLTNNEPYYDCSELWIIGSINSELITDPSGQSVYGFAVIGEKNITGDLSICNFIPETKDIDPSLCKMKWAIVGNNSNDGCYLGICLTPLEHELKHLKCDCNWHKGLKPTKHHIITIMEKV